MEAFGVRYATLRSGASLVAGAAIAALAALELNFERFAPPVAGHTAARNARSSVRSEEHTSELQSRLHLVCRLLLEKKKTHTVRGSARPRRARPNCGPNSSSGRTRCSRAHYIPRSGGVCVPMPQSTSTVECRQAQPA